MDNNQVSGMRKRIYQLVVPSQSGDPLSRAYDIFIIVVAVASLGPITTLGQELFVQLEDLVNYIDIAAAYILMLDYLLRWITADLSRPKYGRIKSFILYPLRPAAIVDLLGILPSLGILPNYFMFLRVFRVVKVFAYSRAFRMMGKMLLRLRTPLLSVLAMTVCYILVVALMVFSIEPETFGSFYYATLWSTTALTSTTYNAIQPTGTVGLLLSQLSTVVGIAVVALPSGIVAGGCIEEMQAAKEDESYYDYNNEIVFDGKPITAYHSMGQYLQENPKVTRYMRVILACCLVNLVLYGFCNAFSLPFWLDTTGTAIAAFMLEPAAGVIVGYVNNLILAIQSGSAGGMLFLSESVVVVLAFGLLFKRGERASAKTVVKVLLLVIIVNSLLQMGISFILADSLTTEFIVLEDILSGVGVPWLLAHYCVFLVDRAIDAIAVLVIFLVFKAAWQNWTERKAS